MLTTYTLTGEITCDPIVEHDAEYNLYTTANSISLAYQKANALEIPAPSAIYELLRFGRIINTAQETLSPNDVPHWREINTTNGQGWVNLNASEITKYSDADFPNWRNWCLIDDSADQDSRCDSPTIRQWLDSNADGKLTIAETTQSLSEPALAAKLAKTICKIPSEWQAATIDTRWGWLKTVTEENPEPFTEEDFAALKAHITALSFDAPELETARWHWNPREFVRHFRRCGWLSAGELEKSFPNAIPSNVHRFYLDLNKLSRKYLGSSMIRQSHFFGQMAHESGQLGKALVEGGNTSGSRQFESEDNYYHGPDSYFNHYENNHNLGNVSPGDGIKFRGRGAIQLTGLYNYTQYWIYRGWISRNSFDDPWWTGTNKRIPQITSPQRVSARQADNQYDTLDSSLSYWARRAVNKPADLVLNQNSIQAVTLKINSAGLHFQQRKTQVLASYKHLGDEL